VSGGFAPPRYPAVFVHVPPHRGGLLLGLPANPKKFDGGRPPLSRFCLDQVAPQNVTGAPGTALRSPTTNVPAARYWNRVVGWASAAGSPVSAPAKAAWTVPGPSGCAGRSVHAAAPVASVTPRQVCADAPAPSVKTTGRSGSGAIPVVDATASFA